MCFRRDQSRTASRTRKPEFAECPWTSSSASLSPPSSQLYFTHSFIFQSLCLTCFGLVCFGTFSDTMIDLNCFCKQWRWCLKTCRFSQQDNVFLAAERHLTLIAHLLSLARKFLKHFNLFQCATTHIPCQAQCHNHFDSLYLVEKEKLQKKISLIVIFDGALGKRLKRFEILSFWNCLNLHLDRNFQTASKLL